MTSCSNTRHRVNTRSSSLYTTFYMATYRDTTPFEQTFDIPLRDIIPKSDTKRPTEMHETSHRHTTTRSDTGLHYQTPDTTNRHVLPHSDRQHPLRNTVLRPEVRQSTQIRALSDKVTVLRDTRSCSDTRHHSHTLQSPQTHGTPLRQTTPFFDM